jgi:flagellar protein FlaF
MPSNPPSNNPYAQAAGAYGDNAQKHTPDQRELEGRILLKAANMIKDLQEGWENISPEILESTLKYNRQIWMVFYDTALENPEGNRPNDLRSNIINLANFIFKRELEIMAKPEKHKLDVLININREIAAGLMTKPSVQNEGAGE